MNELFKIQGLETKRCKNTSQERSRWKLSNRKNISLAAHEQLDKNQKKKEHTVQIH